MEINILPIGVANARPNQDIASYASGGTRGQDNQFLNVFFEVYQDNQTKTQQVYCIKRPGIKTTAMASTSYASGPGLGCFAAHPYTATSIYFASYSSPYATVWRVAESGGNYVTTGLDNCLMPTYKRVNFTNIGLPDDTYTVAWTGQYELYLNKNGGAVTRVQPNGTSADLTRPVYMNNRVFVGDRTSGKIFQSDLGDYDTFPATEFLTVEAYGGKLVDICRFNDFIVAFKEYSMEFFEDVANPNGTVLARNPQAMQQLGCVHPNTIVDTGSGELLWLSMDESGNHSVKRLSNSFQVEDIASEHLSKMLNLLHNYDGTYAFLLNANGHQFYVLTLKQAYMDSTNTSDLTNTTFVYDLKSKLWTLWKSDGENTEFSNSGFTMKTIGRWAVTGACRDGFNTSYVQNYDTGSLHQIDDAIFQDYGNPFDIQIIIANLDFGTFKRKFLNRVTVYADRDYEATNYIHLILNKNDGRSTPITRNIALKGNNNDMGAFSTWALGSFRDITIELRQGVGGINSPLRISAINCDYDIGEGYGIS